jgi:hypothetical protein
VKATYFLAVAFLEILRLNYNGGVLRHSTDGEKLESALTCVFEYLEKPNLAPSIYQCLVAIVHRAFDASMAWLVSTDRSIFMYYIYACCRMILWQTFIVRNDKDS